MNKVFSKSPLILSTSTSGITKAKIEIWVYSGTQSTSGNTNDRDSGEYYVLTSTALKEGDPIYTDISGIINDSIESKYDGEYKTTGKWIDIQQTPITESGEGNQTYTRAFALDGYCYYEEGAKTQDNLSDPKPILIDNRTILVLEDNSFRIPVLSSEASSVTFLLNGEEVYSQSVSASSESDNQVQYINSVGSSAIGDNFRSRAFSMGGIYEPSSCLFNFMDSISIGEVDKVIIGTENGSEVFNIQTICECRYTPVKVTFVNKNGVLQDLIFFKRSDLDINISKENYLSTTSNGLFNATDHSYKDYNVVGRESLTINSGFYPEDNNEVFRQMILSDRAWIYYEDQVRPIVVRSSDMTFKQSVNEKLINYTLEVEMAYNKINIVN